MPEAAVPARAGLGEAVVAIFHLEHRIQKPWDQVPTPLRNCGTNHINFFIFLKAIKCERCVP